MAYRNNVYKRDFIKEVDYGFDANINKIHHSCYLQGFWQSEKYFKENKIHKVNTNHDSKQRRDGIYMMESYIVGERNSSKIFPDLPEGSWVATFYVENDEVWDKIKKGEYNGFSLEGYFIERYEEDMVDNLLMEIESTLTDYVDEDLIEEKIKKLLNIK